jgi:hypothetical protein
VRTYGLHGVVGRTESCGKTMSDVSLSQVLLAIERPKMTGAYGKIHVADRIIAPRHRVFLRWLNSSVRLISI